MSRYHINSKTGTPGKCRATVSCPFGDINADHYSSAEEARAAYEQKHFGDTFSTHRKGELPAYPSVLTAELLKSIPRAADGTTFEENWAHHFAPLTEEEKQSLHSFLEGKLGITNFGRPRGALEVAWLVEDEFDSWEDNPAFPEELAGIYPYAARPLGGKLVASIHTRNGGGNRECYCDDDHSADTCTAAAVEELEDHPTFVKSWDDTGDSTYATFLFELEDTDELKDAIRGDRLAGRQAALRAELAQMENGTLSPLAVMPVHPPTSERILATQKKLTELQNKLSANESKLDPHKRYNLRRFDRRELEDFADELAKPVEDWTEADVRSLSAPLNRRPDALLKTVQQTQVYARAVRQHDEALAEAQAGTIPPGSLALLGGVEKLKKDRSYQARLLERQMEEPNTLRKKITEHLRITSKQEELQDQLRLLKSASRWPGRPAAMPEELRVEA